METVEAKTLKCYVGKRQFFEDKPFQDAKEQAKKASVSVEGEGVQTKNFTGRLYRNFNDYANNLFMITPIF